MRQGLRIFNSGGAERCDENELELIFKTTKRVLSAKRATRNLGLSQKTDYCTFEYHCHDKGEFGGLCKLHRQQVDSLGRKWAAFE